jgi:hypothetical protein
LIGSLTKAMAIGFALAMLLLGSDNAHAGTVEKNYISYLGAAWGPDGDTIYFLKQVVLKQKSTGFLSGLTGGVQTEHSGIWFCKMNWDGSQKQEICEMWPGQGASVDTQGGPVWMEVNTATSNVVFGVEYGMGTVGIWVMGLDGKNLHRPFDLPWSDKEKWRGLHPSWNPDGTKLVYGEQAETMRIAEWDLIKKERRQLTNGPRDEQPSWSPTGDWIVYMHCLHSDDNHKAFRIWLSRPDGSEQKPVVDEKDQPVHGWWPSWSPDGKAVGITFDLLTLADLATKKTQIIDPLPILGECLPWTFMGHHWGRRGWLLSSQGRVVFIDGTTKKARLLALGGIYPTGTSSVDERWGIRPMDMEGKKR